jgi:uncharacterized protein
MCGKAFTVTLEPVAKCNLDCGYCYSAGNSGSDLPQDFFPNAIGQIAQYASERGFDEVDCVWLGGEPLLAGIRFFERVLSYTSKLSSQIIVRHFVQTNGLLLNRDYCRLFRDAGVNVGISIDGPQPIHDAFRLTRGGEPTHSRVMESIGLLRDHHLPFGCVAVVTRLTLGREREVYDFFRSLGCGFRINPAIPGMKGSNDAYRVEPEAYGSSLVRFFDAWISSEAPRVNVSPLDNYLVSVMGGEISECQQQPSCAGASIGVKPDGRVTVCGRFQDMALGNLTQSPISDLMTAAGSEEMRARGHLLEDCHACVNWSICHAGCPHNAVAFGMEIGAKDPFCAAYKAIFAHIRKSFKA